MQSEKVFFSNNNGQRLAASLDTPDSREPFVWALLAHGFTLGRQLTAYRYINQALTDAGIGVLRFDFTGLAESEGDFSATSFSSNVRDIRMAADFLASRSNAPQLLIGHSLGGAAILAAADKIESANAVAVIAAPCNPAHVLALFSGHGQAMEKDGTLVLELGGRRIEMAREFADDINEAATCAATARLDAALLILHSPADTIVSIDHARRIYESAHHPKSFISLDGADHLLGDKADASYVGSVIAAWSQRYFRR